VEESVDIMYMELPAADDRTVLRNIFDKSKQLGEEIYDNLTGEQIMDDPEVFQTVFDTAQSIVAPEIKLPRSAVGDIAQSGSSRPVRRVRFTNVFGDDPGPFLASLRTRRDKPKFSIDRLMEEDTSNLISRAMNPKRSAMFSDDRIVIPYGYKTDAESRLREMRTRYFPFYRRSQRGIDEMNRQVPARLQQVFQGYTPSFVLQPAETRIVYDAMGQENPLVGQSAAFRRRGRAPPVSDVNAAIRRAVAEMMDN